MVEDLIGFPPCLRLPNSLLLAITPSGRHFGNKLLKEKSLSKSSFLIFLCQEPEPVLITLGQLDSWDISTDTGRVATSVFTDPAAISVIIFSQQQSLSRSLGSVP